MHGTSSCKCFLPERWLLWERDPRSCTKSLISWHSPLLFPTLSRKRVSFLLTLTKTALEQTSGASMRIRCSFPDFCCMTRAPGTALLRNFIGFPLICPPLNCYLLHLSVLPVKPFPSHSSPKLPTAT